MPEIDRLSGSTDWIDLDFVQRERGRVNLSMIPPDGEGLQPSFDRRWLRMTECIRKRRRSSFYLSKDTFDGIPISVATHLKLESEPRQCSFEMAGPIDQDRCLGGRHVLLQFAEKQHSKLRCSGWKEPTWRNLFVSGSTAAYSQRRSSFTWITVSSTAM